MAMLQGYRSDPSSSSIRSPMYEAHSCGKFSESMATQLAARRAVRLAPGTACFDAERRFKVSRVTFAARSSYKQRAVAVSAAACSVTAQEDATATLGRLRSKMMGLNMMISSMVSGSGAACCSGIVGDAAALVQVRHQRTGD